jgi:hypothetical protein
MKPKALAKKIVAGIVKDFTGRRGLGQEWDQVDSETQEEIVARWNALALRHIRAACKPRPPSLGVL